MYVKLVELVMNDSEGFQAAVGLGSCSVDIGRQVILGFVDGLQEKTDVFLRALNTIKRRFGLNAQKVPTSGRMRNEVESGL